MKRSNLKNTEQGEREGVSYLCYCPVLFESCQAYIVPMQWDEDRGGEIPLDDTWDRGADLIDPLLRPALKGAHPHARLDPKNE